MKDISLTQTIAELLDVPENRVHLRQQDDSVTARISHVTVTSGDHPQHLVVKQNRGDFLSEDNARETRFYSWVRSQQTAMPVPKCYASRYNVKTLDSLLVLEDHSHTHGNTPWPIPPEMPDCRKAVAAMADIHARFWDHPDLEKTFGPVPEDEHFRRRENHFLGILDAFSRELGDRLSNASWDVFHKAITTYYPMISQRLKTKNAITLCHGDLHAWNFLFPRDDAHPVYIIDWQSWQIGLGVDDLAYMVGLHWEQERKRRYERELLDLYYNILVEKGASGYSHEQCMSDYKLALIGQCLVPLWQWEHKVPAQFWWPHLERACRAAEDA
ncbi:MAG: ecdysteroid 22-kinase family protein, partial [Desulfobacterales bacterium]|nr:ecdysteroid 22-kinase family protein [Desulfobacterales bacterium]